jgi:hypothetical protein
MRPVGDMVNVAVLDGIEVNIIHVRRIVGVVENGVLPEWALSDAASPACRRTGERHRKRQTAGEECLDQRQRVDVSSSPGAASTGHGDDPGERPRRQW